jgi:hypothetical protein
MPAAGSVLGDLVFEQFGEPGLRGGATGGEVR